MRKLKQWEIDSFIEKLKEMDVIQMSDNNNQKCKK